MVIARPVTGKHRTIKNYINIGLFIIFLVLPFIRIGGEPLILLDIPARKFHVFGLTIWPQELYFLHMILLMLGIMLFFFTALFGRIWCGYACPQTLFTEVYNWVGKIVTRGKFNKPSEKKWQRGLVYFSWFVLSVGFSAVFLAYFMPYEEIWRKAITGDVFAEGTKVPSAWAIFMVASTGTAFFNMVYFRENLCKLICPYGRFQAALLDSQSPIVDYDVNRGEPRKQKGQKLWEHGGDCIDCNLCNLVCPTGIDIREGMQIGCISCGLCVDACTNVLSPHGKETLIDYKTIAQSENKEAPRKYFRPRTVLYGSLLAVVLGFFVYFLSVRIPIYANVIRDGGFNVVAIPDTGYQNLYELHVGNMSNEPIQVTVRLNQDGYKIISDSADNMTIDGGGFLNTRLLVQAEENKRPQTGSTSVPLKFVVQQVDKPENKKTIDAVFGFPIQ